MSGPVGGVVGTRFIGELYGFDNLISTDVGGTSFDVGLVSGGFIGIDREPVLAGLLLSLPMMEVHSIGAGGGTISRIDPLTGRLVVGPESAGASPGPACYRKGGTEPTVTDANLVLGYLNPAGLLGGTVDLDAAAAAGRHPHEDGRAAGLEHRGRGDRDPAGDRHPDERGGLRPGLAARQPDGGLRAARLRRGRPGPHVCGYSEGLPLKAVLTFPYAAAFTAFGAASADYEHHYHRAVNVVIPPAADDDVLADVGRRITAAWVRLEEQAVQQMDARASQGLEISLKPPRDGALRQPAQRPDHHLAVCPRDSAAEVRQVLAAFEDLYARVFAKGAQFPQAGYEIFEVGLVAAAHKVKPGW